MSLRVLSVVGARPNFVKMAPVVAALIRRLGADSHVLVHTGQHYDRMLSEVLLDELGSLTPDHMLQVGSASHAVQTARTMERLEPVLIAERPDLILVPGDVNSTLAAALVAAKLLIPIGHVEAGLRSFDRTMPEEINRIVTDQLSEYLFVHSPEAIDNLLAEGQDEGHIHFVGNTMIDSLVAVQERFRALGMPARLDLRERDYLLVTLHRPALVDGPLLQTVLTRLGEVGRELEVVFPAHPRTQKAMLQLEVPPQLKIIDPVSYLEFLSLEAAAAAVLTDSGGVQEETTYLGVPCFTLRNSTERPVTVSSGTNTLLGLHPDRIADIPGLISARAADLPAMPALWDGHAAERLVDVLTTTPAVAARSA